MQSVNACVSVCHVGSANWEKFCSKCVKNTFYIRREEYAALGEKLAVCVILSSFCESVMQSYILPDPLE